MEYLTRQADLITKSARQTRITIIGAGGIGSHTAIALTRMGYHNLTLIDNDVVSLSNVSSQGFDMCDVGKSKVEAVKQKTLRAVRVPIKVSNLRVNENSYIESTDIVILAVDSMQSRKVIHKLYSESTGYGNLINPAMGGEYATMNIYKNNRDDNKEFEKAWFTDEQGVQESCTAKATIYTTLLISGFICKAVKDITMGLPYVRNMAYDIKNNAPTLMFSSTGDNLLE